MPHRAGHSLVPEFSFPQSWEMASQAIPGLMSPEQYRQIGRGLLDFVPGVSTALNWPQMGPWGRLCGTGRARSCDRWREGGSGEGVSKVS